MTARPIMGAAMRLLAAVLAVSLPALAADPSLDGLARGDLVRVTLKDGTTFRGVVLSVVGRNLKLDLADESGAVTGAMVFPRRSLESLERLGRAPAPVPVAVPEETATAPIPRVLPSETPPPTPEERDAALLDRFPPAEWNSERRDGIAAKEAWRRDGEERAFLEAFADWSAAVGRAERAERARLLEEFPPEEGWGAEKREELERALPVVGRALTEKERRFVERFEEWRRAVEEVR